MQEEWKKTVSYSDNFYKQKAEEEQYQKNAEKFWGCTRPDMVERDEFIRTNMPVDPKSQVKNQFVLSK